MLNNVEEATAFEIDVLLNNNLYARTLADSGCISYGVIKESFALKHRLARYAITPIPIRGYDGTKEQTTSEIVITNMDIGGHKTKKACFYVVRNMKYDLILGIEWMRKEGVLFDPANEILTFPDGIEINNKSINDLKRRRYGTYEISAAGLAAIKRRQRKRPGTKIEIFAASMADIDKALAPKKKTDPRTALPDYLQDYIDVFDPVEADKLPEHRPGADHAIELIERDKNGNKPEAPWGPLYNMSREELLVLRKTLHDLLSKGFIRVSKSPAAAPVLFVKKPGGGLRFCVDYRALNAITKKDRYPLPLIHETLQRISKAKWFTKFDVPAAFHKIRIAEGDEWLTAFRTRFGLFEWLVTPFGLANAPSTFQRYINWTLRDLLDDFVTAYIDDILVFTDGSLKEHRQQVRSVLQRLREAGLQVDIDKSEFEVKSTKYLGFIVEAGKGIRMDPAKIKAIQEWQAPTTAKEVRQFLGFANFYRQFIRDYSAVVRPLTNLMRKDVAFEWNDAADQAFRKLKNLFITEPALVPFDPKRKTIMETDSSGYANGGTLSQYDDEGRLRTCAYYSRKLNPVECNYEIHDKELLAIIDCLKQWEAELMSLEAPFTIVTDHNNLRYFTKIQRLNERQMRWQILLSRFNFELVYRPGSQAFRPDALSRRPQDMPKDKYDDRLTYRDRVLLPQASRDRLNDCLKDSSPPSNIQIASMIASPALNNDKELQNFWVEAEAQDDSYPRIKQAVVDNLRTFPRDLNLKVTIADCAVNEQGHLLHRNRRWVPDYEPLRTRIIQRCHDSLLSGHPGHNGTSAIVGRMFFWPHMSQDVRRFTSNCSKCGANTIWRERRQGLLKPLPVPERIWREISIDFIDKLPVSDGYCHLMVIVDRLSKGVILVPLKDLGAETVAREFLRFFVARHGFPRGIISDRGTQFVSEIWSYVCRSAKIERHLSTAWHPQTDGQTERMNAVVEDYLRKHCNYFQNDWSSLLPMAEIAINNRISSTTGMSPFFLTHGYDLEVIDLRDASHEPTTRRKEREIAKDIIEKLAQAADLAQTEMAAAQQRMEESANRHRDAAYTYRVGDKVWLDLRNIRTDRPSKKLDYKHAKFTILEKIGTHAYRLDVPGNIHNVFHTALLRPASENPFPSQEVSNYQPPGQLIDRELEYVVERIEGERTVK